LRTLFDANLTLSSYGFNELTLYILEKESFINRGVVGSHAYKSKNQSRLRRSSGCFYLHQEKVHTFDHKFMVYTIWDDD
jgi:hypothetical protein